MPRLLPHSKINAQKIDADDAYNKVVDRGAGLIDNALESEPGDQQSVVNPERLTKDPAAKARKTGKRP